MVRLAEALSGQHGVVDFEDPLLGPVAAVGFFILLPDQRELVEDEADRVPWRREVRLQRFELLRRLRLRRAPLAVIFCWQVKVKERRVQLAADLEATVVVPEEGWVVVAAVCCQGGQIMGGVGEFEESGGQPLRKHQLSRP